MTYEMFYYVAMVNVPIKTSFLASRTMNKTDLFHHYVFENYLSHSQNLMINFNL